MIPNCASVKYVLSGVPLPAPRDKGGMARQVLLALLVAACSSEEAQMLPMHMLDGHKQHQARQEPVNGEQGIGGSELRQLPPNLGSRPGNHESKSTVDRRHRIQQYMSRVGGASPGRGGRRGGALPAGARARGAARAQTLPSRSSMSEPSTRTEGAPFTRPNPAGAPNFEMGKPKHPTGELIVHKESDRAHIWTWMGFKPVRGTAAAKSSTWLPEEWLPPASQVHFTSRMLKQASCAVVGAASSLDNCSQLDSICDHDIVIRINEHPPRGRCQRTDIQVANQHVCVPKTSTGMPAPRRAPAKARRAARGGAATQSPLPPITSPPPPPAESPSPPPAKSPPPPPLPLPLGRKLEGNLFTWKHPSGKAPQWYPCQIRPLLFRFRTEWNPNDVGRYAAEGAWLSTGVATAHANGAVKRLSNDSRLGVMKKKGAATAGGAAVAFALRACASVSLYGVGGAGQGYSDDAHKVAPGDVHNAEAERNWLDALVRSGKAKAKCYRPLAPSAVRSRAMLSAKRAAAVAAREQVSRAEGERATLEQALAQAKATERRARKQVVDASREATVAERQIEQGDKLRLEALDDAVKEELMALQNRTSTSAGTDSHPRNRSVPVANTNLTAAASPATAAIALDPPAVAPQGLNRSSTEAMRALPSAVDGMGAAMVGRPSA
jgi:chorismate mutase